MNRVNCIEEHHLQSIEFSYWFAEHFQITNYNKSTPKLHQGMWQLHIN